MRGCENECEATQYPLRTTKEMLGTFTIINTLLEADMFRSTATPAGAPRFDSVAGLAREGMRSAIQTHARKPRVAAVKYTSGLTETNQ